MTGAELSLRKVECQNKIHRRARASRPFAAWIAPVRPHVYDDATDDAPSPNSETDRYRLPLPKT